jgi:electron transfer flavoprotein alpha/beta subunit
LYICVCIKQTPDSASVCIDPITGDVDYERFVQVLNPADACAVEAAVRLKEALYCRGDPRGRPEINDTHTHSELGNPRTQSAIGNTGCTIKVLTLGPKDAEGVLRAALAIGADSALRLWNAYAGEWGPFTVAAALAGYLNSETFLPDLVICGDSSSDWSSGIVGPALAAQLDLPQVTSVMQLTLLEAGVILSEAKDLAAAPLKMTVQLTRKLERGYRELLEAELPLLITVTGDLNEPRYPSLPAHLAALKADIPVLDPQTQMSSTWLNGMDEMTLLEIHAPRPLPRHIPAPDSRHSAYQRIGEIVAGGATGRKTQLVQGTPEELAKVLVDFLKDRGFV